MSELNYNNIDLENESLYKYVLEMNDLEKLINEVGPKNPESFGKMEAFKNNNENKKKSKSKWIIFVIIILLIIAVVMLSGSCGKTTGSLSNNYDFLSPDFDSDVRIMFKKN